MSATSRLVRLKHRITGHEFTGLPGLYDDCDVIDKPAFDAAGHPLAAKPNRTHAARTAVADTTPPRGKALDAALDAAGLPKSGTVAEKQARLAEHNADSGDTVTPQED